MDNKPAKSGNGKLHKKHPCVKCNAACCRYIAIEIPEPKDISDFELVKWYLDHEKVTVYIDEDMDWFAHVEVQCKHIGKQNECRIYEKRSQICREYGVHECERYDPDSLNFAEFSSTNEFELFFSQNYNIKNGKCKKKKSGSY
ncbi:MAG: YkgJ family cysteine cluster protein [Planctomycetes bacterium]|nr:YkgJ family cysteine cluster protein [Planctomycetota bacterium]